MNSRLQCSLHVELIGGASDGARVYTGGVLSSSSRAVVGAGNPVPGFSGYCSSGQTSGEQCNQLVLSTASIVCTQVGCDWPMIAYVGDRGGPAGIVLPTECLGPGVRARLGHAGDGTITDAGPWSLMSSTMGVSIGT